MSISWDEQLKIVASDGNAGDQFGHSTDIYGDYAIIGANEKMVDGTGSTGQAYIFKKDDGAETWTLQATLNHSDQNNSDRFGICVSIYKNYAIIGAYQAHPASGSDEVGIYI